MHDVCKRKKADKLQQTKRQSNQVVNFFQSSPFRDVEIASKRRTDFSKKISI